jgi:hypothetical protein
MNAMKKSLFLIPVFLFGALAAAYSQDLTAAPDQSAVAVETNGQTNIAAAAKPADTSTAATEKEVTPAAGIVYNDGKTDYASSDVKFVINAKDDVSGVKQIDVMMDDSQFGPYNNPVGFDQEGKHVLFYKVEDNVGNISPLKSYEFILDKTAPETEIVSDKKIIKIGDTVFTGSNNNFGILAQDAYSGVKSVTYAIDAAAEATYDKPLAPIGTNGLHQIVFSAADNVGNVSEKKTYMFYLDLNAPVVEFSVNPAAFVKDNVNYISGASLITIAAKDAETGVSVIRYSVDGGDYVVYAYPIKLAAGVHSVKAKAVDLVGNESAEVEYAVTVDASDPQADLVPTKK